MRTLTLRPQGDTTRAHVAGLTSQSPRTQEGKPWHQSTGGEDAGCEAPMKAAGQPLPPCEPAYGGVVAPAGSRIHDPPPPFSLTFWYPEAAERCLCGHVGVSGALAW
jgi:hypothetical protein